MNETVKEHSEERSHLPPVQGVTPHAPSQVRPEVIAALQESFVKFDALYRAVAKSGG